MKLHGAPQRISRQRLGQIMIVSRSAAQKVAVMPAADSPASAVYIGIL